MGLLVIKVSVIIESGNCLNRIGSSACASPIVPSDHVFRKTFSTWLELKGVTFHLFFHQKFA